MDPDEDSDNSSVYVQGLNDNVTLEDLADFFKQCGVVKVRGTCVCAGERPFTSRGRAQRKGVGCLLPASCPVRPLPWSWAALMGSEASCPVAQAPQQNLCRARPSAPPSATQKAAVLKDSEEASLCGSAAGGMCDSLRERGGGESGGGCGEAAAQFLHSREPAGEAAGPVPAFGCRGVAVGVVSQRALSLTTELPSGSVISN